MLNNVGQTRHSLMPVTHQASGAIGDGAVTHYSMIEEVWNHEWTRVRQVFSRRSASYGGHDGEAGTNRAPHNSSAYTRQLCRTPTRQICRVTGEERRIPEGESGKHRLLLSVINWGEIYYSILRRTSSQVAEEKASQIAEMPIEIVPVADDLALARQAAIFKANHKIAYADAFAAALAKTERAELVTGDPEFKQLEDSIRIRWLRE